VAIPGSWTLGFIIWPLQGREIGVWALGRRNVYV
jgi:hypothetical protein